MTRIITAMAAAMEVPMTQATTAKAVPSISM